MDKTEMVYHFMDTMDQIKLIPKDFNNLSDKDKLNYSFRLKLLVEQMEKLFDNSYSNMNAFLPVFQYLKTLISFHSKDIILNREGILESLLDIDYVNIGTSIHLQLPLEQTFPTLHKNNMAKYDKFSGRVNKRIDGKVTAPFDYKPEVIQVSG